MASERGGPACSRHANTGGPAPPTLGTGTATGTPAVGTAVRGTRSRTPGSPKDARRSGTARMGPTRATSTEGPAGAACSAPASGVPVTAAPTCGTGRPATATACPAGSQRASRGGAGPAARRERPAARVGVPTPATTSHKPRAKATALSTSSPGTRRTVTAALATSRASWASEGKRGSTWGRAPCSPCTTPRA